MAVDVGHWVDGKAWDGTSGRFGAVTNPATGEVTARVALAAAADVDTVVQSARAAAREWRSVSLSRRARVLFALREQLEQRKDELAARITAEHGKVLSDARGEVARGIEVVEFACGIPHLLAGDHSEQVSTDTDVYSIRQPLGVVAGITPFNFPAMVPMWMFPIAIACGNAFVLKPSERDPSASLLIAELWREAGLPDGVFNVVQGDREAVDALLAHPDVAAISFVGSTPVAKYIYATAAANGKRVQALGGAKNHMIVLPDADLDAAADAAVSAGFGSAGERCMAISVVVAVDPIGDDLVGRIVERIDAVRVADGTDPDADMGPLVTGAHRDRVVSLVDAGVASGAALVVDGRGLNVEGRADGFWLGPCLFDHVRPDMSIYTEEIFGPVLNVVRAGSYEDAVRLVNESPYGNGVALFTRDGGAARRFQFEVEAGMVGINIPIPVPMAYYSFGGWGASLFGDTHVHGAEGVRFYTRGKVVTSRFADPATRGPDLGFPQNR
ncbi:MAG TPA: CoA-acylating methylmalonate-semialdehyde dehydrogenase [Acidimicrobiia bacterium]|jgi:malonate-semialdehyde dehydrogenase (acetylating)/methylmalonate-semialdehyde dehydrogenase|nr:CoA-acylating methylmalonate-semialdehyde dehydrogenase [Acidimicrobiia bacterium]